MSFTQIDWLLKAFFEADFMFSGLDSRQKAEGLNEASRQTPLCRSC